MERMRITIAGKGRVGSHLALAFAPHAQVTCVCSRTLDGLPEDDDLYIIAVSDDAVSHVARAIDSRVKGGVIAHTSGTRGLDDIPPREAGRGVFYPMQTFSKGVDLDYAAVPVFIEGDTPASSRRLTEAASLFSDNVRSADGNTRLALHVAAVLSCNFVNRLYAHADALLKDAGLPLDVMRPLMEETLRKTGDVSPAEGQTGPAARGDMATMERHLNLLASRPGTAEIYRLLSRDILLAYHPEKILEK